MREGEAAHNYTPIIIKYRVVKLYKESSPCVYKGGVGRKIFRKHVALEITVLLALLESYHLAILLQYAIV